MVKRLGAALGLLLLCAIAALRVGRPPAPVPATAPDTVFSAERAMRHVEAIAARPHALGTADHDRVRDYIVSQLTAMGLRSQIQRATGIGTRYAEAGQVQNILAWLPGSSPQGKALLIVAHYDGVEAGPAASDDGAGCAALLETLRALRARRTPLAHDVFVLFSDGEEAGLLGAAAFAREHPWAKDVAMVLNFEARGTNGRSFMFETGPGNLDAARVLRAAGDATAGSVFTTVYRMLPNDTDLSELAVLGQPALNFAFARGVERYHTTRDDPTHLDPGSLQHHGSQMLSLAKIIGDGPLPRPRTGDAAFFDLPLVGLVVYPVGWSMVFAVVAVLLVIVVVRVVTRKGGRVLAGTGVATAAVVLSGVVAALATRAFSATAMWSGLSVVAVILLALAITVGCAAAGHRWTSTADVHTGSLIIWALIALAAAIKAPGTSYLFIWPLVFAASAELWTRGRMTARWVAAIVAILMVGGLVYGAGAVMLGATGAGGIAVAVLTSLLALLLLPLLAFVAGDARWLGAPWLLAAAIIAFIAVALTVRPTADRPLRSALVYAEDADSTDAWFGSSSGASTPWARGVIGTPAPAPAWTRRLLDFGDAFVGRRVARIPLDAPNARLVRDTVIKGARRIVFRVTAPSGTTTLVMRAVGAKVLTSSIDGRIVDTTRYRYPSRDWTMAYSAVPDSGAIVALSVPVGASIELEMAARRPGLPAVPGLVVPSRPEYVVPSQTGDVTVSYRSIRF